MPLSWQRRDEALGGEQAKKAQKLYDEKIELRAGVIRGWYEIASSDAFSSTKRKGRKTRLRRA